MKRAGVLLSGGVDSTTTLAVARERGFETYALTFRYGQRHAAEVEAARRVAQALGAAAHEVVAIDLRAFGGSALTADIPVPKGRSEAEIGKGIPVTYVPARNTIFLSYALAWAEVLGAQDIFIGVTQIDYAGYPDCRPEYIGAYERMANLATKTGVEGGQKLKIHTPLIHLSKAEIIAQAWHKRRALPPQPRQLVEERGDRPLAIASRAGHLGLIPWLERRPVGAQDDADPPGEAALLGLDEVADDLLGAPLTRRGMPGGDTLGQRAELGAQRRHGGLEERRDLGRRQR